MVPACVAAAPSSGDRRRTTCVGQGDFTPESQGDSADTVALSMRKKQAVRQHSQIQLDIGTRQTIAYRNPLNRRTFRFQLRGARQLGAHAGATQPALAT